MADRPGEGDREGGAGGERGGGGEGGRGGGDRPLPLPAEAGAGADTWGKRKPSRCPSCGAFPDRYREIWEGHGISFPADEAGRPAKEGYLFEGGPYKVIAVCRCGKRWTLRGVSQIVELEQQPEG